MIINKNRCRLFNFENFNKVKSDLKINSRTLTTTDDIKYL